MNKKTFFKASMLLSLPLILTLFVNCNNIELNSHWRAREISIDGMQFDWENTLVNIKDKKVNLGLLNDDEYLYICLVPLDQNIIRQAMTQGFTVWFEPDSDPKKKSGICYPIGIQSSNMPLRDFMAKKNPEEHRKVIEKSLKKIEIIGPDKNKAITIPVTNPTGIEVRVGTRNERMVYELKIPLAESDEHFYAVGALPGNEIKVQFETGEFKKSAMNRPSGIRPDGNMDRRGGGGKGMRPGAGGRERPDMPEPMKMSVKVLLASADSDKP